MKLAHVPSAKPSLHEGVALIAVLWMVLALSIIVTGMTRSVRQEARVAVLARNGLEATGSGQAAINLVLQEMVATNAPLVNLHYRSVVYQDQTIEVEVMPLNGLIDINNAPVPLLEKLFVVAGGLAPDVATKLAEVVVQVRQPTPAASLKRFDAAEDLMLVPGVTYDLYARLQGIVTADIRGSGKVNPLAAPPEVLTVLSGGNQANAQRIAAERKAGKEGIDTTTLDAALTDNAAVRRIRLQARVQMADGGWFRLSHFVDLNFRAKDGMPWRIFRVESRAEPMLPPNPE